MVILRSTTEKKSPDWFDDNHRGTAKLRRQPSKGSIARKPVCRKAGGFFDSKEGKKNENDSVEMPSVR